MKTSTDAFDLVLIMVFMICGVGLFSSLMIILNRSEMEYLDDKTLTYQYSIEYDYTDPNMAGIPTNVGMLSVDKYTASMIPLVQDSYCPTDADLLLYPGYGTVEHTTVGKTTIDGRKNNPDGSNKWAKMKPGNSTWKAYRMSALKDHLWNDVVNYNAGDGVKYMVYNSDAETWILTDTYVSIFSGY